MSEKRTRVDLTTGPRRHRHTRRLGSRLTFVGVAVAVLGLFLAPSAAADSGLSIVKTAVPAEAGSVTPGDTIAYTVEISNAGPDAATGVTVTDATPANTTYVADSATIDDSTVIDASTNPFESGLSIADIPMGETTTLTFEVTVNSPLPDGSTISNTASAEAANDPASPVSDGADHTVTSSPQLRVDKLAAPAEGGSVKPGDHIDYAIIIENEAAGTDVATGLELTDTTPANTTYVAGSATLDDNPIPGTDNPFAFGQALSDLAPGERHTATFRVRVEEPLPNETPISNTATVSAANHADVSDSANHTVSSAPTLTVDKTAEPAEGGTIKPGETITYSIAVTNEFGATETATNVVVTDPAPEDTTFVEGSATLDGAPVAGSGNPFATGFALPEMEPGDSHTLSLQVMVSSPLENGKSLANTVTVASDQTESLQDTVTHTVDSEAILSITKSAFPAEATLVTPGTTIDYTILVENDATATDLGRGLVLTDPTPENTTFVAESATLDGAPLPGAENPLEAGLALADLAPDESHVVTYSVTVDLPLANGTVITNLATLTASNHSEVSDGADHTVDSEAVVTAGAEITPAEGSRVEPGDKITYRLTFQNDAAATATLTNVVFTNPTPEHTTFVDGSALVNGSPPSEGGGEGDGEGDGEGEQVEVQQAGVNPFETGLALPDLLPGESHTIRFRVEVASSAPDKAQIRNTATLSSDALEAPVEVVSTHRVRNPDPGDGSGDGSGSGGDGSGSGGSSDGTGSGGSAFGSTDGLTGSTGGTGSSGGAALANTGIDASPMLAFGLGMILLGGILHSMGRTPGSRPQPVRSPVTGASTFVETFFYGPRRRR